jgi:hypothetical protein
LTPLPQEFDELDHDAVAKIEERVTFLQVCAKTTLRGLYQLPVLKTIDEY